VLPIEIALVVFACVLGGALLGMFLQIVAPDHHLNQASQDVIKLGMGLIATMAALVLGLVISMAKSSYDQQAEAVKHSAAKVLLLDHVLANYGSETKDTRDLIRKILTERVDEIWPEDHSSRARSDGPNVVTRVQGIEARLLQLSPQSDAQSWLKSQALQISNDIMEARWLGLGSLHSSVPLPFLVVVVFWLTIVFGSFGLFAPRNVTVLVVLFLCALSIAGSIFLILEMSHPFEGLMKISSAPMRYALSQLGQ
jgi:hypothetical protein